MAWFPNLLSDVQKHITNFFQKPLSPFEKVLTESIPFQILQNQLSVRDLVNLKRVSTQLRKVISENGSSITRMLGVNLHHITVNTKLPETLSQFNPKIELVQEAFDAAASSFKSGIDSQEVLLSLKKIKTLVCTLGSGYQELYKRSLLEKIAKLQIKIDPTEAKKTIDEFKVNDSSYYSSLSKWIMHMAPIDLNAAIQALADLKGMLIKHYAIDGVYGEYFLFALLHVIEVEACIDPESAERRIQEFDHADDTPRKDLSRPFKCLARVALVRAWAQTDYEKAREQLKLIETDNAKLEAHCILAKAVFSDHKPLAELYINKAMHIWAQLPSESIRQQFHALVHRADAESVVCKFISLSTTNRAIEVHGLLKSKQLKKKALKEKVGYVKKGPISRLENHMVAKALPKYVALCAQPAFSQLDYLHTSARSTKF